MPLLEEHRAIVTWLRSYVGEFRIERRLHPMLQSKWVHSARVARLCRDLAAELDWTPEDRSAAETAGWIHDVGRFSQWSEYGTYHDGSSINHAARGHEVLASKSPLGSRTTARGAELLDAVRCHNMLEVPANLAASSRPLVGMVRDGDKLDIFEVVLSYLAQGRLGELLPRLQADGPVNPVLVGEIVTTRRATYANAKSIADFLLILVSWVYDLNYSPSLRLVRKRRVLDRVRAYLPGSGDAARLLSGAEEHVARA